MEGTRGSEPTVGDLARDDVVLARLDERAGEVRQRVADSPYPFALVLSKGRTLLGRVAKSDLDGDPEGRVDELMNPGPSTVRPHKTAEGIAADLAKRDLRWAIVTSSEGELIGVVSRAELEGRVKAQE